MSAVSSSTAPGLLGRRLEGKVAIITGGASGIGEATAKLFCQHGAKVVIADIQDDLGRTVCTAIGPDDIITFVHCDVSKESDIKNAVHLAVTKYGKLDIMFNNAGIADHPHKKIMDAEVTEFERVMGVNCTGVFLGIKHAAGAMIAAGTQGSIINTSSTVSIVGGYTYGYVASKNAVTGLTRNAAAEMGQHGIRVNCISPHVLATPLAKGRFGREEKSLEEWVHGMANMKSGVVLKAEDIAHVAVYLGSDEAKYISGHNLVVDGGMTTVNHSLGHFRQEE